MHLRSLARATRAKALMVIDSGVTFQVPKVMLRQ